ncbi:receptor like protein kinase S.2-like protein [Tanacetum coccineum]
MYFSTALMFILTVLDIIVYYLQKQQGEYDNEHKCLSQSPSLDQLSVHEADHHGERTCSSLSSPLNKQCRVFSLAEIKLATRDFDDALVIGKGGFGKVYKGKFDFWTGVDVAIKRSNIDSNQGATEFWAEIEMLSKFRHSHIVSLLGYCEEIGTREMILVYEYMPNGSLDDHLHKKRSNRSDSSPLTWIQMLNICIGAARGLDYLHTGTGVQSRIIHRDIKSSNVLLDENFAAKISDFGTSRTGPAYQSGSTTNVYTGQIIGTFGYMDAEYFLTHRLTRKSDVYAFGVVLLEVLCGRPALDFTLEERQYSLAGWAKQCIKEGKIGRIIDPYLWGQVKDKCLKEFGQIAYECLHTRSKDRPTMTKVLSRLEFVLAWTLRSQQSARDRKYIRRTVFIDKALSLFWKKPLNRGCHTGGNATASQLVVPCSGQPILPMNVKSFTLSELQNATRDFHKDGILGEGGFGRVFKGWLDTVPYASQKTGNGLAVAIKKLATESFQGLEEWQAEVDFLGKLSHPNIVKLCGYCYEGTELLLVYELMQGGSLDDHIFARKAPPLPWYTRIKISMGAAQGLAFLHADFNAKLSDFGMCKLGPLNGESHVTTRLMGTYGYAAPEYISTGQLYIKSDVYGFGVVMLEIITGLRVLDTRRDGNKHNLVDWALPFLENRKRLPRIMDPRLEQLYPMKGANKAARLILSCLHPDPNNRPSMEEVVSVLKVISTIEGNPRHLKANTKHL